MLIGKRENRDDLVVEKLQFLQEPFLIKAIVYELFWIIMRSPNFMTNN